MQALSSIKTNLSAFYRCIHMQRWHGVLSCAARLKSIATQRHSGSEKLCQICSFMSQCLQGTRTEILSQITEWVSSTGDNVLCVLWLSGPAGKGKSVIAHTIVKWFNDLRGGLGSCDSFDRR
ncbi:hypothetical protein BDR07DRAFT_575605 [Suillus spraguei]|nr:hypothetical protein BDR07DRAFT_575605 [Suillus spraguei]